MSACKAQLQEITLLTCPSLDSGLFQGMLLAAPQDRALSLSLLSGGGAGTLTPVAELWPPGSLFAFSFPAAPPEALNFRNPFTTKSAALEDTGQ
jgi:hypothetical protein